MSRPFTLLGMPVGFVEVGCLAVTILTMSGWAYMFYHRSWPPLRTKSLPLMGGAALGSFLWVFGVIAYEAPRSDPWLRYCQHNGDILEIGVFLFIWVQVVRAYRYNQILVHHNAEMWSPIRQLLVGLSFTFVPYRIVSWSYTLFVAEDKQWLVVEQGESCREDRSQGDAEGIWSPIIDNVQTVSQATGVVLMVYYGFSLRKVRAQFNEARAVFGGVVLGLLAIARSALGLLSQYQLVFDTAVVAIVFWSFMWSPLYHLIKRDPDYLYRYTYGLSTLPTPELLKQRLEGQMSNRMFRERFREFTGKRFAEENLEFYEAVEEWELEVAWFRRQALAVTIIDLFIRAGSDKEINIPHGTREKILESPVTDLDLFKAAKSIVVKLMEDDLAPEFQNTAEMQDLVKDADVEAQELAVAKAAGLIATPTAPPPPN